MKPSYGGAFAPTSTLRRAPTSPELAGGLPCGPADQKLFNEFFYLVTMLADEVRNVLVAASITPNEATSTQLRDAILALAPAVGGGGSTTFATLAEHLAGTSQTLSTHPYGVAHMITDAVAAITLPVIPGVSDPVTYDSGTNKYGARKATVSLGGYGRVANSAEAIAGTSATIDGINLPWITPELLAMVITDRLDAWGASRSGSPLAWAAPADSVLYNGRMIGATGAANLPIRLCTVPLIGGVYPLKFELVSGALPTGCVLDRLTGIISQTAVSVVAVSTFGIKVTDGIGRSLTQQFKISPSNVAYDGNFSHDDYYHRWYTTLSGSGLVCYVGDDLQLAGDLIAPKPLEADASTVGVATQILTPSRRRATADALILFTNVISAGTLPPGVTIKAVSGLVNYYYLSGAPTAPGDYNFTVGVPGPNLAGMVSTHFIRVLP